MITKTVINKDQHQQYNQGSDGNVGSGKHRVRAHVAETEMAAAASQVQNPPTVASFHTPARDKRSEFLQVNHERCLLLYYDTVLRELQTLLYGRESNATATITTSKTTASSTTDKIMKITDLT